jgi:hypothetical protein
VVIDVNFEITSALFCVHDFDLAIVLSIFRPCRSWDVIVYDPIAESAIPHHLFGICMLPSSERNQMNKPDTVIAIFDDHLAAETAVKKLAEAGFEMKNLSVVGKGYHTEENVVGFYNIGDRVKFWGRRGAFWGGLWGLFFGGLFLTIPVLGHVIVLGYLAVTLISAVEGAVVVGGLSSLGAALYSIGIPKNSVVQYEADVKADGFLVMAHGTSEETARARTILGAVNPSRIDVHEGEHARQLADQITYAS